MGVSELLVEPRKLRAKLFGVFYKEMKCVNSALLWCNVGNNVLRVRAVCDPPPRFDEWLCLSQEPETTECEECDEYAAFNRPGSHYYQQFGNDEDVEVCCEHGKKFHKKR